MGKKGKALKKEQVKDAPDEEMAEVKVKAEVDESDNVEKEDSKVDIKKVPEEVATKRNRHARLIVRNLSFKATTKQLKKLFSSFGELTDIQILRKPNGRLVGCAFVEFALKTKAAKAIAHVSGKPFLDRPIVVDWAIKKDRYTTKSNGSEGPETNGDDKTGILDGTSVKEEESDGSDNSSEDDDEDTNSPKSDDDNSDSEHDDASQDDESEDGDSGDEDEDDDDDDDDSEDDDDDKDRKIHKKESLGPRKPLRESHDISEGCTVFVKNIPFSVNNQEFRKCMKKFGPIYYALICIDHLTEHSKGTGFVKFRSKHSADACNAAGSNGEITLRGSVLETQPALTREDLQKSSQKTEVKKDNRNLFLVKEGIILAGSPAATGVSHADMAKRLQLEQWKTQMLRNLNKFVSKYRLVIHNLPPSYDDAQFRALCLKYGGTKPVIREARVMRDLRNVEASGKGKSKEFGFVTFTDHENALYALRALNNNPNIFSPAKRPIVAFSIEDKSVMNIRQKRLEKSRAGLLRRQTNEAPQKEWEKKRREDKMQRGKNKNANISQTKSPNTPIVSQNPTNNSEKKLSKKEKNKLKLKKLEEKWRQSNPKAGVPKNIEGADFMGEASKQGESGIMSRKKIRAQAEIQSKMSKLKKKKDRKKQQSSAIMKLKQPKQKENKQKGSKEDPQFSKLVSKYRSQLVSSEGERKKWYE